MDNKTKHPNYSIGKMRRSETFESFQTPGPASYRFQEFMGSGSKSVIIPQRKDFTPIKGNDSPGPNIYKPIVISRHQPSYSYYKKDRQSTKRKNK